MAIDELHSNLILCLGNEIVSDDGFGAVIAGLLLGDPEVTSVVDVRFEPVAGFVLIDLLENRDKVLIIDTIQTGHAPPGWLHRFSSDVFVPAKHLTSSHQINLPTALNLGRKLGLSMPTKIDILAVEAGDLETLSEELTPAIAASVESAVNAVKQWILTTSTPQKNTRPVKPGKLPRARSKTIPAGGKSSSI